MLILLGIALKSLLIAGVTLGALALLRRRSAAITSLRRLLWQRRKKDNLLSRPNNRHPVEHPFSVRHRSGKCPEQPTRKYQKVRM